MSVVERKLKAFEDPLGRIHVGFSVGELVDVDALAGGCLEEEDFEELERDLVIVSIEGRRVHIGEALDRVAHEMHLVAGGAELPVGLVSWMIDP